MKGGIIALVLLALLFYGVFVYRTALFTRSKDRFTVGIYGAQPAVYSFSKSSGIVTVVMFDPEAYVQIPGGYEWYKLSSAGLLGKIDNKENSVLQRTFETLIGAPVDVIIFGNMAFKGSPDVRIKKILSKNLFDRFFVRKILTARNDKLLVIDARSSTYPEKGQRRYRQEALDTRLRGYFYQKQSSSLPVIIAAPEKKGKGGERLARIIEGTGIKVLEVEYRAPDVKTCSFTGPEKQKEALKHLIDHWNCTYVNANRKNILFQPGSALATLYL